MSGRREPHGRVADDPELLPVLAVELGARARAVRVLREDIDAPTSEASGKRRIRREAAQQRHI